MTHIEIDTEEQVIQVDGVRIHLDLLRAFANPNPNKLYRMVRENDVTTVREAFQYFRHGRRQVERAR